MAERAKKAARVLSVAAATVIALACGTNYAYSAWAPEFAEKLKLSSTQSNLIGTFGNLGMYTAGIPVGMLVDSRGPRPGVLLGGITMGTGYFSMYRAYKSGPDSVHMPWLCLYAYLTGIGGCAAFAGSVKTSALNWPKHRGTATAFPLSAFGLSAFFFATISSLAFPDNTSDLLLLLAVLTFAMCFISGFFLRVVPASEGYSAIPNPIERSTSNSSTLLERTKSEDSRHSTGRLSYEAGMQSETNSLHDDSSKAPAAQLDEAEAPYHGAEETSSLLSQSSGSGPGDIPYGNQNAKPATGHDSHRLDIRGLALLSKTKFWQLWTMMGLLAGIGLMTINNIGNDAKAIWHHYDDSASPEFIQERQLMHVEILSIMSFCGRFMSGVGSDLIVRKLGMSRFWCLLISSLIFLSAQLCGIRIENPHALGFLSGLSGLAYGFLFGVFPALVAETFGVTGFSQNWGCMTLAPVVSGNIFNLLYGHILDRHSIILPDGQRDCREGLLCYRTAYWVTLGASLVGVGISLWSIRHDWVGKTKGKREHERDREA